MLCPLCKTALRAGESNNVKRDGKTFRRIRLYCKSKGCPRNNGQPISVQEIEIKETDQHDAE